MSRHYVVRNAPLPLRHWRLTLGLGGTIYAIAYAVLRSSQMQTLAGWINTAVQVFLDAVTAYLGCLIWRRLDKSTKPIALLLIIAACCGVVSDGVYGILVNVIGLSSPDADPRAIPYLTAYTMYLLLWVVVWIFIALRALSQQWLRMEVLAAAAVLLLGLAIFFGVLYIPVVISSHYLPWIKTIHAILTCIELLGVFAATFCMILLPRISIVLASLGFSTLTIADFTLRVTEILSVLPKVSPFELLWTGGQMLMIAGMCRALEGDFRRDATSQVVFRASLSAFLAIACLTPALIGGVLAVLIDNVGMRSSALLAILILTAGGICVLSKHLQAAAETLLRRITVTAITEQATPQEWLAKFLWKALNFEKLGSILPTAIEKIQGLQVNIGQAFIERYTNMGDTYGISQSQVGAVGPKAHVHDVIFTQDTLDRAARMDLEKIAAELESLRASLGSRAKSSEEVQALGAVIDARDAAQKRDARSMLSALRRAGKWALDTATEIGTHVAAEAITLALGLK